MKANDPLVAEAKAGKAHKVYLFHGEEFLARSAAQAIVDALVPEERRTLNLSVLDGASASDAARDLETLPMFPGTKVVWVREPEYLAPKKGNRGDQLARLRELWEQGRQREAARRLLALAQKAGLDPEKAGAAEWESEAGLQPDAADLAFCAEAAAWAREQGVSAPAADLGDLERLLDKGIPDGHHLVISAGTVDGRLGIVKKLIAAGVERSFRAKGRQQQRDVGALCQEFLAPWGKTIQPAAVARLEGLIGGNQVRRLHLELEKVALYVGDRPNIEAADVDAVVERSAEVEFLLTSSIERRDLGGALAGLSQLLEEGSLVQAVASIAACLRQLLAAQEATRRTGRMPGFGAAAQPWVEVYQSAGMKMGNPNAAKFRAEAAARFRRDELVRCLLMAAEVDSAVKSGGGRLEVERLLWHACGK